MVLEQACKLSPEPRIRLAAVLHDLGKAQTPQDVLPRHIGHEQRSLPLIQAFCERLRIPKNYAVCALHLAEFHTLCHRALELRGATMGKLFQRLDAYRKPQALDDFLLGSLADSRGRKGFEDNDYPQLGYLQEADKIACQINAKDIMAQGFSGREISLQLEQQRVRALELYRQEKGASI